MQKARAEDTPRSTYADRWSGREGHAKLGHVDRPSIIPGIRPRVLFNESLAQFELAASQAAALDYHTVPHLDVVLGPELAPFAVQLQYLLEEQQAPTRWVKVSALP